VPSTSCEPVAPAEVVGSTVPRIYTPPLVTGPPGPCGCGCALTPETSEGFDYVRFADEVLGRPFDPWQRWVVIHAGELLPDGSLRFRHVLVVVARQNGKSEIPIILGLAWLLVDRRPCVLWTSTQLKYADKALDKAESCARASGAFDLPEKRWKKVILGSSVLKDGENEFVTATANGEGGRSLTVHRLVQDELREHKDYAAWGAAVPAMGAVPDAQAWHLSNAGEDHSVVLNEQQDAAHKAIEGGDTTTNTFLAEYSAPDRSAPDDLPALAQANPGMGYHGPGARELLGEARTAMAAGGEALAKFRTEKMCIRVRHLDPAVDPDAWERAAEVGDLLALRARVALCLDVAPDSAHATVVAAATDPQGRTRVEVVGSWTGRGCVDALRRELLPLVQRIRPAALGWFPGGPAAALAADLGAVGKSMPEVRRSPLGRVLGRAPEAIRGDVAACCMGFAQRVADGLVLHSDDPLLTAHVVAAEKLSTGDRWAFSRRGGHCDAAYAAAGATHLALTLPFPIGRQRIVRPARPGLSE